MEYYSDKNRKELDKQCRELLDCIKHARDLQTRYGDATLSDVISYIGKDLQDFINDHPEYNPEL